MNVTFGAAAAAARAIFSISGSGSTASTDPAWAANAIASCPGPQPRSSTPVGLVETAELRDAVDQRWCVVRPPGQVVGCGRLEAMRIERHSLAQFIHQANSCVGKSWTGGNSDHRDLCHRAARSASRLAATMTRASEMSPPPTSPATAETVASMAGPRPASQVVSGSAAPRGERLDGDPPVGGGERVHRPVARDPLDMVADRQRPRRRRDATDAHRLADRVVDPGGDRDRATRPPRR